jgi:hypothetical protein
VKKQTFQPLVSGLALRAALVPFLALVLVARAADWERTLVAGNKDVTSGHNADGVATYLADSHTFRLVTLHQQDRKKGQHIPIQIYTTSQRELVTLQSPPAP